MSRTEEWTKDIEGMTSTCVVEVFLGERVNVSEQIAEEFGLDPGLGKDVAVPAKEKFALEYSYQAVADALAHEGWTRVPAATES